MKNKVVSIILFVSVLVMGCSTTTSFFVFDQATGNELTDYTIQIEERTLHPGETILLSNGVWKEYNAIVRKDGYRCTVPCYTGAIESAKEREELWDKYYTGASEQLRQSVEQNKTVKRA